VAIELILRLCLKIHLKKSNKRKKYLKEQSETVLEREELLLDKLYSDKSLIAM